MANEPTGRSGGLGRGLGSLLANTSTDMPAQNSEGSAIQASTDSTSAVTGARYAELPVDAIRPNPRQPREVFDQDALDELVHSIKEIGLLQPVVVRALDIGKYELVAGERRLRSSKLAGLTHIPAIIRETADADMLRDALLENLHRAQLNPLEEAAAYQQLLDDFGCTQEELAARIGRSRPQVTNTLRFLKLPATVQKRVAAGVLTAGHAKALAGVANAEMCEALAAKVVAQGLSVRALEELIALAATGKNRLATIKNKRKSTSGDYPEVADQLAQTLDTRVTIRKPLNSQAGTIVVEFADQEDLRRIVTQMCN